MGKAETIAWEHSEPGSGPTPVYDDPDKAEANGWRLDSPPAAFKDPFLERFVDLIVPLPYEADREEG